MFAKRPTRNETEDDILRQQEEFLRQKGKSTTPQPQQNLNNNQNANSETEQSTPASTSAPLNAIDIDNLKIQIVERDLGQNPEYAMLYVNRNVDVVQSENGFPTATNLNLSSYSNNVSKRGPSLYAQKHLKKSVPNKMEGDNSSMPMDDDSGIVTGVGLGSEHWKRDIAEIKHENKKLIDNMSVDEIEAMRADLLKKLNPKTVAFLQSKKFKYRSEVIKESEQKAEEEMMQVDKENETTTAMDTVTDIDVADKLAIPIEEVQTKKYPNMNVIEKEKLSWLGDIPKKDTNTASKDITTKETVDFSARFNFEGDLISLEKAEEVDVHEGLHHHGEEPERPGYTVNELFMYLQSSFPSQKQIGLKVFEKIISKSYQGMYDACFNTNLIEYLLKDTPLVLVVRTCLDDTGETVWKSAISTLKAIVCNTIYDEIFLDRGYLIFEDYLNFGYKIDLKLQPVLDKEAEIDEQVPDQQYAMYDLVACLLNRTSILQRFAYLIKSYLHLGEVVFIEEMLDILIRMARHSREAAESILASSDLMDALCSQLINRNVLMSQCRLMHCKAFKLVRVCISSIKSTSNTESLPSSLNQLFNRFNDISFIDSLNLSLSLNPEDVTQSTARILLNISIESLRTWLKLLSLVSPKWNHSFLDALQRNFGQMFPSFVKILNFCKSLTPVECDPNLTRSTFDFQFASCVISLVKMYHEIIGPQNEYAPVYCFDLFDIAMRWFTVINNDSVVPDFDTSICLLVLSEFILKHCQLQDNFVNVAFVKLFNENDRFGARLFELCRKNSNTAILKHETPGTVRDSDNHPSFGSIYFKRSRSVPLLNIDSPICLLHALIRIASSVTSHHHQQRSLSTKMTLRLSDYITLVNSNITKDFSPNIFDLIEINIVSQACLLIPKQNIIQPQVCKSVLKFALQIHVLNSNQIKQQMIGQVLFNHHLYSSLSTNGSHSVQQFESFKNVYRKYSKFDYNYWLFHLLLAKSGEGEAAIELAELLSCLQYIDLVCATFPEHLDQIDLSKSALFLMISSVFLVDDSHFFNADIRALLEKFLVHLLQSPEGIVVLREDTIPHYGNVVDFFNKLVSQFENCSYGDPVFCNYLLVFFQQKCSAYFRNFFFSEHPSLIKVVHIQFDQLLLPMENFLFPLETNLETLEIYLKTLLCEVLSPQASPVLYCQMVHHLNHALFRDNSPIKQRLLLSSPNDSNDITKADKWKLDKLILSVEKSQNQRLRQHLLEYSHFDVTSQFGLALKQP